MALGSELPPELLVAALCLVTLSAAAAGLGSSMEAGAKAFEVWGPPRDSTRQTDWFGAQVLGCDSNKDLAGCLEPGESVVH